MPNGFVLHFPAHIIVALMPSLGGWIVIGVFGAMFMGRWLLAGQIKNKLSPVQRTHQTGLDRIFQLRVPISFGIACICGFVAVELMRDGKWTLGLMALICSAAATALGFTLGRR